jgi:hypothetical protein
MKDQKDFEQSLHEITRVHNVETNKMESELDQMES